MKTFMTPTIVQLYIVFGTLNLLCSTDLTISAAPKESELTSLPVTTESVEEGLRMNREALRALPEFQTKNVPTHLRLAKILSQQGDPNGAIEEYQAALALNPLLSEAYRELGAVYIDKHEWEKAEQVLRKGTTLNSHDHQTWYWLGRSLIAQEHFYQARKAFETAAHLAPNDAKIHSDLGLTLMTQGHNKEAEKALKKAIILQPDFAEAHDRLERVLAAHGDSTQLILSARHILQTLFYRH